ncbi:MAG TPA: diaminopimelate decarboxylase [Terriglobales bacterium]|jgi:diaminopimelate decarboxylase|nr:diaminopimelate decarboxylase [Terriglobales bacterium]
MPSPRPPAFVYRGSRLCCERLPLARLAERFGTPLYVYSATAIGQRYRAFDRAIPLPHTLCYSVKANSSLALLRLLGAMGSGFDVVSGGELERVLRAAPRAASNVVFSGVGKTAPEMDDALRAGILMFNVESAGELDLLAERAARLRCRARVALRVNPDVPADTHPHLSTGRLEHKFGVPMAQAHSLYRRAAREKYLEVAGVSAHIGSQITSAAPFAATARRLAELVRDLRSDGHRITYLDLGGGLGIPYRDNREAAALFRVYGRAIAQPLRGLKVHLLLEPGRAIVGPAGALLTRVLYLKRDGRRHFLVVDAAMNDLLRPALYDAYHEVVPVEALAGDRRPATAVFDVVGPICETGDFLACGRRLPIPAPGDLLAVLDVGAYGMSLASNYNSRPLAAEVLVEGARARLIRRRQVAADLFRQEI